MYNLHELDMEGFEVKNVKEVFRTNSIFLLGSIESKEKEIKVALYKYYVESFRRSIIKGIISIDLDGIDNLYSNDIESCQKLFYRIKDNFSKFENGTKAKMKKEKYVDTQLDNFPLLEGGVLEAYKEKYKDLPYYYNGKGLHKMIMQEKGTYKGIT